MAPRKVTVAVRHYDRTLALLAGMVAPDEVEAKAFVTGGPRPDTDVWETNLWGYILMRSRGEPITAIPVFPRRISPHSIIFVNTRSGIRSPQDLVGKRVGVNYYQGTPPTLIRGILQHEFGILPEQIPTWVPEGPELVPFASGKPPEGINVVLPTDKRPTKMLLDGELDALMSPNVPHTILEGAPHIARLFPDAKERDKAYFRDHGFYPINHVMVMKAEVAAANPGWALQVYEAFVESQQIGFRYYNDATWSHLPWTGQALEEHYLALGSDAWAQGLARNRKNLEYFMELQVEQRILDRPLPVETLFAEETLGT